MRNLLAAVIASSLTPKCPTKDSMLVAQWRWKISKSVVAIAQRIGAIPILVAVVLIGLFISGIGLARVQGAHQGTLTYHPFPDCGEVKPSSANRRLLILLQGLGSNTDLDPKSNRLAGLSGKQKAIRNWDQIVTGVGSGELGIRDLYGDILYFSYSPTNSIEYHKEDSWKNVSDSVDVLHDTIEICHGRGWATFDLVGHSLGGVVASEYIKQYGLDGNQAGWVKHVIPLDSPVNGAWTLRCANQGDQALCAPVRELLRGLLQVPELEAFVGKPAAIELGEWHRTQPDRDADNYANAKALFYRQGVIYRTLLNNDSHLILSRDAGSASWYDYRYPECLPADILLGDRLLTVESSDSSVWRIPSYQGDGAFSKGFDMSWSCKDSWGDKDYGHNRIVSDARLYPEFLRYLRNTLCGGPVGTHNPACAGSPDPSTEPTPLPVPTRTLSDDEATFIHDVTLPDNDPSVLPGQALVKTWRMRNTGSTTWGSGYQLAFVSGEQMGAPNAVSVPTTAPGSTADISINLTAPTSGGDHAGYWRLRNPQGTYFGQDIWVKIKLPGGQAGDIEIKSVEYPSVVAPNQAFRPKVTVKVNRGQLLQSRGDMLRNTDNNLYGAWPHVAVAGTVNAGQSYTFEFYQNNPITAPSSQGTYESKWRVWQNGNWAGPEIIIRFDVRVGSGTRPNPPSLVSPGDWYVSRDGSTPQLCANAPAGLQYYFQIYQSHDIPESSWISNNCWTPPTLGAYGYQWHVKVSDPGTSLESDWSQTWHFGIDSQQLSLDDFTFIPSSPSAADEVQVRTCVQGFGGIGNSLQIWANTATDCSANGSWYWIDPKGNFCYDPAKPQEWPEFHTRPLADGCHLIRATGFHGDLRTVKETNYTLQRRRPSNVQLINPGQDAWFNTRTITFRWNPEESQRVNSFTFHVSTNPDPIVNPIVTQTFNGATREYTYTFSQDYASLYWRVQACNELGCGDAAVGHFGIDQIPPSSAVEPLNLTTFDTAFRVGWTGGTDNASGIRWYDVQYRDGERGTWVDWQTNVTNTAAIFNGQSGHTYYYRARALDNAGNLELYPSGDSADTMTTVNPAAAPQTPWWNIAYAHKHNVVILNNVGAVMAAGYPARLRFDSGTTPTAAELYAASQSSTKGDDVRIVYNNATELPRWIQQFTSAQVDIWFKTQANIGGNGSSQTDYQLYYGNATASNPPADIDNVMPPGRDANTMGLWHFTDGAGSTFVDTSGRGHNGNLPNAHGWGDDAFGPYIEWFGGGDGAAWGEVPSSSDFDLNALTLEAWVYPASGGTPEMTIFYRPLSSPDTCPGYKLAVSDMKIDLQLNCAGGRDIDGQLAPDTWYHIAATFDGSNMRIYRNGNLIRTVSYGQSVRSTAGRSLYLGGTPFSQAFKGRVRNARISNFARTDFSYAANIAAINIPPSVAVGDAILPPATGSPDLAVVGLSTYPNSGGGVLVQAIVQNQGNLSTQNGIFTDLYVNHVPTGKRDYAGSIRFWVNDPIAPGATVTLTTVITDLTTLSGSFLHSASAVGEASGTLYAQTDSAGVVSETNSLNNIYSAGTGVCVASPDAYESDDAFGSASVIAVNQSQAHNLDRPGDRDWVKFDVLGGVTYTLQTLNLGLSADTYLYIYDTDGTTLLASNDDYGGSLASHVEWMAPVTGTYYVLVRHWNPNVGGCGTGYELSVARGHPTRVYLPIILRNFASEVIRADFSAAPTSGSLPLVVQFTDQSSGAVTSRLWNFGDGSLTSSERNPLHTFISAGAYTVSLRVSGPSGSGTLTRSNYINVVASPVANFAASPTSGNRPLTVVFENTSSGVVTSWAWTFGDGGGSTQQNPVHNYAAAGLYTVSLRASGPAGSDTLTRTNYITVTEPVVVADFSASPTNGNHPLTVFFADASRGVVTSWAWTFGDSGSSTERNPTHNYTSPGVYTVSLHVSGPGGSDTLTRAGYITVSHAPTVLYVASTGTDIGNTCANFAVPCATVQHAVDVAWPGDEIRVAAGTYTGVNVRPRNDVIATGVVTQVVYITKTVAVRGGYTTTNWITPNPVVYPTTLDAQGKGRVLYITGSISPTIEGLHITGGNAAGLGGITSGATTYDVGGGVYVITATPILSNNWVFNNTAYNGGGLFLREASNPAILNNNTVFSNTATNDGGGLYLYFSPAMLDDNTVISNTSNYGGGGLFLWYSATTLTGNTIASNTAGGYGGGLLILGNVAFNGNIVISNTAHWDGGGLYLCYSSSTLNGNMVTSNTASWGGGGLYLWSSDAMLNGNTIASNTAGWGGGLSLHTSAAILTNTVVTDNQASSQGSGLNVEASLPRLLHTTLARNVGGNGIGVYVTGGSMVALANAILVSHTVGISVTSGNTATLEATLWGNSVNWGGAGTIVTGTHNYWGDPAFVHHAAGNYHIGATSAAIDKGVNAGVTTDIDGDVRPVGAGYDLGADEYNFAPIGTNYRVSVSSNGVQGNNGSLSTHHRAISANGRYVVFTSDATNLVISDTNGFRDAFVRDLQSGITTRVSVASDGAQGNGDSGYIGGGAPFAPGISDDGQYVVFESLASNLVPSDTNGVKDVFVRDLQAGTTARVSIASDGTQANGPSYDPFISADGRYVVFESMASNLVSGDTVDSADIFVHDRDTGQTTRVSISSNGIPGNAGSGHATISADGRYVAFDSYASNLVTGDSNGAQDIFVRDRQTGETTRVSVASNGFQANGNSREPMISADGRWVVFGSDASNLVPGDTNGTQDVFLHDRTTGQTFRVSVASGGSQTNDMSNVPSVSRDGRYVAFQSPASNLVVGDTNSAWDVFVHDQVSGETVRISTDSAGVQGNSYSWNTSISASGRFVVFSSLADNLVAGDTNGNWDVFVRDRGESIGRIAFNCGIEVCIINADGAGQTSLATGGSVTWSPDGARIAFDTTRDGNSEIYVMNADGSGQTRLTNNPAGDGLPAWSPDGTRTAFQSDRDGNNEIYVMNVDGTGQTRLTNNPASDALAAWSPDSRQIVFVSNRDGNDEIYVMNADGAGQIRLTNNSVSDVFPDWSPDGQRIVFSSNYIVYVMNADGTGRTALTDGSTFNDYPVWSPDGTRIAYDSYLDGNWQIYVMKADGTEQTRVTYNSTTNFAPAWQPVRASRWDTLAFVSDRDGDHEIYTMKSDGTDPVKLTSNTVDDDGPSWSPDGNRIVFHSGRDGYHQIYVMNSDGINQSRLITSSVWDEWPYWSPGGNKIAFSRLADHDGTGTHSEVFVANSDGTLVTRLTYSGHATDYAWPSGWSPDGASILFYWYREGYDQLWIMNANGSNQRKLTADTYWNAIPSMSPDGARIAFSSNRDGNAEIYVMDADGTHQTRLTFAPDEDWRPTWSRDGSKIIFESTRDGRRQIYWMNPDGSQQTRLTDNTTNDDQAAWRP